MSVNECRPDPLDVLVIGGGVNGCGIARDAAGRGLCVMLAEAGDLAQATSSASTKLIHGGLRYLEHGAFRLVREALREREVLWRAMPHVAWPLRFVLPHHSGLRPAWMLRLGLFLYDHLGGRELLPGARSVDLRKAEAGGPLQQAFRLGFEYSDCWVDDSRMVVLNAVDAAHRGATILTRTRVVQAQRDEGHWRVRLDGPQGQREVVTRALVNAAGPWAGAVAGLALGHAGVEPLRLVRGSHIVTRRLFDHDKAYIFQSGDGRVVFAIPYEQDFTLIGTTDVDHDGDPSAAVCTDEEAEYLCAAVSSYFADRVTVRDIVWRFSGVRALQEDGSRTAANATRDYRLVLDTDGAPVLTVLGGKITTYRRLAENAVDKVAGVLGHRVSGWTSGVALPGGNFPVDGVDAEIERLRARYPFLDGSWARRLVRGYGTLAEKMLGSARTPADLGTAFGATLHAREVQWLVEEEFARTAEDILWRRSKLGLRLSGEQVSAVSECVHSVLS